jgi:radical SAM superfamily enzyme YgiQ (UPF0313 family)
MAKVLLIQPNDDIRTKKVEKEHWTPLSLIYIGTAIEEKHDVKIYDRNLDIEDRNIINFISKYNPDIIGFTSMTSSMLIDLIHLGKLIKEKFQKKIIVVGGIHATIDPNSMLNEHYIDYIIRGEGDEAFLEFCDTFDKNKKRLDKLKNINLNQLRPYIEMDKIKIPNYNLLDLKKYNQFYVSISRGCPGNCTFCYSAKQWGIDGKPFVRSFSVKKSKEIFRKIVEDYNFKVFSIVDDNFISFKTKAIEICKFLEPYNINFWCFARVDFINDDILINLKKAGCHTIQIGAESGNQRVLDFLNKKTTVKKNIDAINCCKKNKIICDASFMIGLPTETLDEMRNTIDLIKKYRPDIANVKIFNPLPGAPLFDYCIEKNLIEKPTSLKEWAMWTGGHRGVNHNVSTTTKENLEKISQELWRTNHYKYKIKRLIFWIKKREIKLVLEGIKRMIKTRGKLYKLE